MLEQLELCLLSCIFLLYLSRKCEVRLLELGKLLQESIVRLCLLSLSFHIFECIVERHGKELHYEHDDGGRRARLTHCAVNEALVLKVRVFFVDLSE